MEAHRRTRFDDHSLIVDGAAVPLWAATVHYWRLPRGRWARALATLRELGLTAIEAPLSWGAHARDADRYDFAGDRDLGAFLDAAAAADLRVIAQLGPLVATEPSAGLPDHVARDEAMWARTASDTPAWLPTLARAVPLPSLASTAFTEALAGWYRTVAAILAPRSGPGGPVIALGLDVGVAALVRSGAYDVDYHPDAIAAWRAHRDVAPPRAWTDDDVASAAAWVRWNRGAAARATVRWSQLLDDVGLADLARLGGAAPTTPTDDHGAVPWPRVVDLASGTHDHALVATRMATTHRPRLVRLPAGHAAAFAPTTEPARAAVALAALAAGARGAIWTMGVATDRWLGALTTDDGKPTAEGRRVATLLAAIARHDLPALHRQIDVALIVPRADAAIGHAASLVDPLPPAALELLGLGSAGAAALSRDADAARARSWFAAVTTALGLGQVAFTIVDADADLAAIPAKAFVTPTLARIERGLWRALQRLAADRRVVVLGPELPTRDELDQPLAADAASPRRAGLMRAGSLEDLPGLAADLAAIAPRDAWIAIRPAGVTTTTLATVDGRVRALFVDNATDRAARAVIAVPAGATIVDALTDAALPITSGELTLELPAKSVRWLAIR